MLSTYLIPGFTNNFTEVTTNSNTGTGGGWSYFPTFYLGGCFHFTQEDTLESFWKYRKIYDMQYTKILKSLQFFIYNIHFP